ncbi:PREDICTED: GRAM domain-containing protein 2 isoform X5 [Crocodylus porosus]|uniref:GRAM domain-containing protein 2 isoform X5 n=1 Tax=Crocodylus porosus TaxID=8502 RepID=UPI00093F3632|nr:PREDICTED: GRAM domain-containing protein 2 isoform X5 [Crocodylus porosus]
MQLAVPQAVQGHSHGGERPESLLLCASERHPHSGTALHLPQLALLLCKPLWEGHQGGYPSGLGAADKKAQDSPVAAQWPGYHHQCQQKVRFPPKYPALARQLALKPVINYHGHQWELSYYIFVSLISRDSVYDVLKRVCTHLQVSSKKSLSLKEFTEEPDSVSLEVIVPEVKWRKVSPASLSLSLPNADYQCIHRTSISSISTKERSFNSEEPLVSESAINTEEELEAEPNCVAELRPPDYQLLKIFIVLICLLVVSSSYLAFRIFRLEQQLCSLNRDYLSRGHRR